MTSRAFVNARALVDEDLVVADEGLDVRETWVQGRLMRVTEYATA